MTYINQIQAFYDWLETNPVSSPSIALWYALMHTANKSGWKQDFSCAISTLELKTGLNKQAIIRARNQLTQNGLISFKSRGGNQSAIYTINYLVEQKERNFDMQNNAVLQKEPCFVTQSDTQSDTQNDTQSDTQVLRKVIPLVDKTKTRQDEIIDKRCAKAHLKTPHEDLLLEKNFSEPLRAKLSEWLRYRQELGKNYKPTATGTKSLLSEVEKRQAQHGDAAIIMLINECMANGWKGIIWERIKPEAQDKKPKASYDIDAFEKSGAFDKFKEDGP